MPSHAQYPGYGPYSPGSGWTTTYQSNGQFVATYHDYTGALPPVSTPWPNPWGGQFPDPSYTYPPSGSYNSSGDITATLTWVSNSPDDQPPADQQQSLIVQEDASATAQWHGPGVCPPEYVRVVSDGLNDPGVVNYDTPEADTLVSRGSYLIQVGVTRGADGVYRAVLPTRHLVASGTHGPGGWFTTVPIAYSALLPHGILGGTYINKDSPVDGTYGPLPNPLVLYGGSVRFTADELLLDAANPNPVPGTTYSWYAFGPGGYVPPSGGSTWNVVLKAAPGTVTFACLVRAPNAPPTIKTLTVEVGIRTDDTVLIGWIDTTGVPLQSGAAAVAAGIDPEILADFAPGLGTGLPGTDPSYPFELYQRGRAAGDIAELARNDDRFIPLLNMPRLYTPIERDYILNWLFKYAFNPDPTPVLQNLHTRDYTNPNPPPSTWDDPNPLPINTTSDFTCYDGYMDYLKYQAYIADGHRFKLLNRFQVKYRVDLTNPSVFNGSPILLQHEALIGLTDDPTGVVSGVESVLQPTLELLSSIPDLFTGYAGLAATEAANANHTLTDPQAGPANGLIGPMPATSRISQSNDGSPDIPAIRAFNTLMAQHMATPLFWQNIGSKITFTCGSAAPDIPTRENYPTYYWCGNGVFIRRFIQWPTPKGHFYANAYPFGEYPSYGLLPEIFGGPLSFPDLPGGRNGIATTAGDDPSSPTPPYTVP